MPVWRAVVQIQKQLDGVLVPGIDIVTPGLPHAQRLRIGFHADRLNVKRVGVPVDPDLGGLMRPLPAFHRKGAQPAECVVPLQERDRGGHRVFLCKLIAFHPFLEQLFFQCDLGGMAFGKRGILLLFHRLLSRLELRPGKTDHLFVQQALGNPPRQ